ncbi:hypothetical protein B296_00055494, partial [Ensete ventricosum]
KLSVDYESEYGGAGLGDQDQEVSMDAAIGRGHKHRGRSRRDRVVRSCIARVPRKRRRAAMGPASIEEEEPLIEIACSIVDGHRLDQLYIRADPSDHAEKKLSLDSVVEN